MRYKCTECEHGPCFIEAKWRPDIDCLREPSHPDLRAEAKWRKVMA